MRARGAIARSPRGRATAGGGRPRSVQPAGLRRAAGGRRRGRRRRRHRPARCAAPVLAAVGSVPGRNASRITVARAGPGQQAGLGVDPHQPDARAARGTASPAGRSSAAAMNSTKIGSAGARALLSVAQALGLVEADVDADHQVGREADEPGVRGCRWWCRSCRRPACRSRARALPVPRSTTPCSIVDHLVGARAGRSPARAGRAAPARG